MKTRFIRTVVIVALLGPSAWAANGHLDSTAQFDKIKIGATTSQQLTEILGPPASVAKYPRRGVEDWGYWVRGAQYSIEIDSQGIVRSIQRIIQYGP